MSAPQGYTDAGSGVSFKLHPGYNPEAWDTDLPYVSATIRFDLPGEEPCEGAIAFARPKNPSPAEAERPLWKVNSLDPLDVEPSIQCPRHPHHHGHIRGGRWQ